MKAMPCATCQATALLRDGTPYLMGRTPHGGFPMRVYCSRCHRVTYLTAKEFNQLPTVPSGSETETSSEKPDDSTPT